MNKLLPTLFLLIFSSGIFAQDKIEDELKTLSDNKQYDKIIKDYSKKSDDYSAKSLYYVGLAYYMKEDDNNCLQFMNSSIAKDPQDASTLYIKGMTLSYMMKYDDAIKCFRSAVLIYPKSTQYWTALGDAYYNLEKDDLALESYKKAIEQPEPSVRSYSMLGQIYSDQKNPEKALEVYYVAKSKLDKASDSYSTALFNIGMMEALKGDYDKAEASYLELIQLSPKDYHAYAKLIQAYYGKKEYEKAKPYKEILYKAFKKGDLKDNLKDMFCFDQFKWNGKLIQAYERFEEGTSKDIYNKHVFYVLNTNEEIEFKIQTEYSAISVELGGPKYLLCMQRGDKHSTFSIGFNDDFKYDDLKKSVIDVLEEKIKAGASSQPK